MVLRVHLKWREKEKAISFIWSFILLRRLNHFFEACCKVLSHIARERYFHFSLFEMI